MQHAWKARGMDAGRAMTVASITSVRSMRNRYDESMPRAS